MNRLITWAPQGGTSSPWINFRNIHKANISILISWMNRRDDILKSFNATAHFGSIPEYIEFEHEEDYIRFLLEYS